MASFQSSKDQFNETLMAEWNSKARSRCHLGQLQPCTKPQKLALPKMYYEVQVLNSLTKTTQLDNNIISKWNDTKLSGLHVHEYCYMINEGDDHW